MKEIKTDKGVYIKFHWIWVLWQTIKIKVRNK